MPKKGRRGHGHSKKKQSRKSVGKNVRKPPKEEHRIRMEQQRARRAKKKREDENRKRERIRIQHQNLSSSPPVRFLREQKHKMNMERLFRAKETSKLFDKSPPVKHLRKLFQGKKRGRNNEDPLRSLFEGLPARKRRKITAILDAGVYRFEKQNEEEKEILHEQIAIAEAEIEQVKKLESRLRNINRELIVDNIRSAEEKEKLFDEIIEFHISAN